MLTTDTWRPSRTAAVEPTVLVTAGHARRGRLLRGVGLAAGLVGLVVVVIASVALGAKSIPVGDVAAALLAFDGSTDHVVVRSLRVPRTLLGLGVGAALGLAGAVMQGVRSRPIRRSPGCRPSSEAPSSPSPSAPPPPWLSPPR